MACGRIGSRKAKGALPKGVPGVLCLARMIAADNRRVGARIAMSLLADAPSCGTAPPPPSLARPAEPRKAILSSVNGDFRIALVLSRRLKQPKSSIEFSSGFQGPSQSVRQPIGDASIGADSQSWASEGRTA